MNNIATNTDIAKNCIPYSKLTVPFVITESIIKRTKDIMAVVKMTIRENKYLLNTFADFLIGKIP